MKILIVDDQPSARSMLRHVLEGLGPGLSVEDFGDPQEALNWSEQYPPDLLLLDYRMPGMDGLEFARRFRKPLARRDVPIVLITVVGDEPVRQAALDAGVIDFMVKPIRPRELRARCKNLLSLRQQGETVKQRARSLERQVQTGLREVEERERDIFLRLANVLEYRGHGGGLRLLRMARYCGILASAMGLPEDDVAVIELAAPLHDIGEIGIPESILLKRGDLAAEERTAMEKHTSIGFETLGDSDSRFLQMAALIALRHHERFDGSGYPDGLHGNNIPIAARIVAVADVFDALTTDRPQRKAWTNDQAFDYLQEKSGSLFDPACIEALVDSRNEVEAVQTGMRAGINNHH